LDIYRRLFSIAADWLSPKGLMLLEIESTLGLKALNLACDSFLQSAIHLHQDHTGRDRLLEIILP